VWLGGLGKLEKIKIKNLVALGFKPVTFQLVE
jgi:hypothetical protein